jgi:hypothetical protein
VKDFKTGELDWVDDCVFFPLFRDRGNYNYLENPPDVTPLKNLEELPTQNSPFQGLGNLNSHILNPLLNGTKCWQVHGKQLLRWDFNNLVTNPVLAIWSLGNSNETVKVRVMSGKHDLTAVRLAEMDFMNNGAETHLYNSSSNRGFFGNEGYGLVMIPGSFQSIQLEADWGEVYWNVKIGSYTLL